ncbi:hypothetical protein CTheo_5463 [Ceratobasidium theobromae]|uniref:Uncharacterized protein n=1 Tax=Ceratobasidium theobromae TaxID=1582974 RepID=A0A5N5QH78_9AGAM|nr:hypothetical protein CTheo_5463 [Ceratobasidium theobromae]
MLTNGCSSQYRVSSRRLAFPLPPPMESKACAGDAVAVGADVADGATGSEAQDGPAAWATTAGATSAAAATAVATGGHGVAGAVAATAEPGERGGAGGVAGGGLADGEAAATAEPTRRGVAEGERAGACGVCADATHGGGPGADGGGASAATETQCEPGYRESLAPRPEAALRESSVFPTPRASERPASPDIAYILRTTPRPRPSASLPRRLMSPPSSFRPVSRTPSTSSRRSSTVTASSAGFDVDGAEVFYGDQYDSADSDSDLDLCTPLPHMMLRAGLLSPRSTIITDVLESPSGLSARGEALRAKGEKVWRQETRRKIRHRDGQNLRDGVGLTTGLGWSDSEDEDAPSPLRRRLSSVLLARAQSRPPSQLSRQSLSTMTLSRRSTCSNLDSTSVSSQSNPRTPASHPLTLPHIPPPLPLSLPLTPSSLPGAMDADEGKLDFPMPPTATSWRGQPSPGLRKQPSGLLRSTSSSTAGGTCLGLARTRTPSNSGASQSRTSRPPSLAPTSPRLPQLSLTSRPIKVAVRTPSATRLSAPEALRPTDKIPPVDTRRMSGT